MDWTVHMGRILSRLGEDVAFTHGAGQPATVHGIFMSAYQVADLGFPGVTGNNPYFAAMSSDIGAVSPDDVLVRAGVTYKVKVKRPDDPSGIVVLDLKRI